MCEHESNKSLAGNHLSQWNRLNQYVLVGGHIAIAFLRCIHGHQCSNSRTLLMMMVVIMMISFAVLCIGLSKHLMLMAVDICD